MTDKPAAEPGSWRHYVQRVRGYLRGDQACAESLDDSPNPDPVGWMQDTDPERVDYAREVAKAGFERADAALVSLQAKADATVKLVLTLAPIAFAVTGFALASDGDPEAAKWFGFVAFCFVDVCLVAAGLLSFLASGLVLTGGVNPEVMPKRAPDDTLEGLKGSEADAWYYAMVVTNWSGKRVAADLFHARRMVVWALLLAALGSPFISIGL